MKKLLGFLISLIALPAFADQGFNAFVASLPAASSVAGTDLIPCVQSAVSDKCTPAQISTYIFGNVPATGVAYGTPASINLANATFPTLNQNTSGTAANLSGTPALPNGTTATTQTGGDNTTKLATDAFVQSALPIGGNPTATVGTSAVNGSATSFMRSDGAPAIDLTMVPTWTGNHTYSKTAPQTFWNQTGAGANLGTWAIGLASGVWSISTVTDALGAGSNVLSATRGATTNLTNITIGTATGAPTYTLPGGNATFSGSVTATNLTPTSATLGGNRIYLPAANTVGISANATQAATFTSTVDTMVGTTFTAPNATTIAFAAMTSSTAAQTGTVCFTTTTLTFDPSNTCLVSARRFKEAIRPIDLGLAAVLKLQPVFYKLKPELLDDAQAKDPNLIGEQEGFIAEEVQAIDPRLVTTDADGQVHTVRYMQMTALLTKAIQELNAKVERQQTEIYALLVWCLLLTGYLIFARAKR